MDEYEQLGPEFAKAMEASSFNVMRDRAKETIEKMDEAALALVERTTSQWREILSAHVDLDNPREIYTYITGMMVGIALSEQRGAEAARGLGYILSYELGEDV